MMLIHKWFKRKRKKLPTLARRLPFFEPLEDRRMLAYYESFESELGSEWEITSVDPQARVEIRDLAAEGMITSGPSFEYTQGGNNHALVFDSTNNGGGSDLGIAILSIDLSGYDDAFLTFHHYEDGDDDEHELDDLHSTFDEGDGVAISDNRRDWYTLYDQKGNNLTRNGDGLWMLRQIDLGSEMERINDSYSNEFLDFDEPLWIKFSQYDNRSLPSEGWAIDEIRIEASTPEFSPGRPKGAAHRFTIPGEHEDDFFYRVAMFGNVDATTPILVSHHGRSGEFGNSHIKNWQEYVRANPQIHSLIVVAPSFPIMGRFRDGHSMGGLSWNDEDNAATDLAILAAVDALDDAGVGDASKLYLWGFSGGGQFAIRFTAAHPDRVAAAVSGGPSSSLWPTEAVAWKYGAGLDPDNPPPPGVNVDIDTFLRSRVMFWVGENDHELHGESFDDDPEPESVMGVHRAERTTNAFEAWHAAAAERVIPPDEYQYELFIQEGNAHEWNTDNLDEIYQFLIGGQNQSQSPVRVHGRIVASPTQHDHVDQLPQNLSQVAPNSKVHLELWVEHPQGVSQRVQSGEMDLYIDRDVAVINPSQISHGAAFNVAADHDYDDVGEPSYIRGFRGTASSTSDTKFSLFGRVGLTTNNVISKPDQLLIALLRSDQQDFKLSNGSSQRTDFMPIPRTAITRAYSGVQGTVYLDADSNGLVGRNETGVPRREVRLETAGSATKIARSIEPDDVGDGAYLNWADPWVTLSAEGPIVLSTGVRSSQRSSSLDASTGRSIFQSFTSEGTKTSWKFGRNTLRADFHAPATQVSIDVVSNSSSDYGRLNAYNSNGQLLESALTGRLREGEVERLTITRPSADIAYALAAGDNVNDDAVRLDNFSFEVLAIQTTDDQGFYSFPDVDPGSYQLAVEPPAGWLGTAPQDARVAVTIPTGTLLANLDFGIADTQPPQPVITPSQSTSTSASLLSFVVDFGEPISGFTAADITVSGGTVTQFATTDAQRFSFSVTPSSDGTVDVEIRAGVVTDLAGLANLASTKISTVVDRSAPTPLLTSTSPSLTNQSTLPFIVAFTEVVSGFTASDLSVANGSITDFTSTDGQNYSITIVPDGDGIVSVQVPAGIAIDQAGLSNQASEIVTKTSDRTSPAPSITADSSNPTQRDTIAMTIDFGERITGIEATDLIIAGATISGFSSTDNRHYTFDLMIPTAGTASVEVPGDATIDLAGNMNLASRFEIVRDTMRPVAVISVAATSPTNLQTIDATITFTEPVVGFSLNDLTLVGFQASDLKTDDEQTFSFRLAPLADGIATISILDSATTDAAGNGNLPDTQSVTSDRTPPTVIGFSPSLIENASSGFDTVVFSLSESLVAASVSTDDVQLLGPTGQDRSDELTAIAVDGSTLTVTLATQTTPGEYTVIIGPDVQDGAGNRLDQDGDRNAGEVTEDQFTATVHINGIPIARDDSYRIDEDGVSSLPILSNDVDPDGALDPAQVTIVNNPSHGAVDVDPATGVATYTPSKDFFGEDSFTYTVRDNHNINSAIANVQIVVRAVNDPPTEVRLSETRVAENELGATIGRLSVSDVDESGVHSFVLSDPRFEVISGLLVLKSNQQLDFESESTIDLRITATDSGAQSITSEFQLNVADKNDRPTDLVLSNNRVGEDKLPGTIVGTFTSIDQDIDDSHTYSIVSDTGSPFTIEGHTLVVADPSQLDFETASSHDITIRVVDAGQASLTKSIKISVNDINERPLSISLDSATVPENAPGAIVGEIDVQDHDAGDSHVLSVSDDRFEVVGTTLKLRDGQSLVRSSASPVVQVTATDAGGLELVESFTINISVRTMPYRNANQPLDSNGDGEVTPIDALIIINYLNSTSPRELPVPPLAAIENFLDTNGDNVISPVDVLLVINYLNGDRTVSAEGSLSSHAIQTQDCVSQTVSLNENHKIPIIAPPGGFRRSSPAFRVAKPKEAPRGSDREPLERHSVTQDSTLRASIDEA